jgi:hypothetical protein
MGNVEEDEIDLKSEVYGKRVISACSRCRGSAWNQCCAASLSCGSVSAFIVRATGGGGGERVARGVSRGCVSAWSTAGG